MMLYHVKRFNFLQMLRESVILVNHRQESTTEVKEKVAEQIELVGNLTYEIDCVVSLQASLPVDNKIVPISSPQ